MRGGGSVYIRNTLHLLEYITLYMLYYNGKVLLTGGAKLTVVACTSTIKKKTYEEEICS